ncbi:MAG: hypothetical protein RQ952_06460 [Thermoproteota archaeon]|jgi:hypothetical protein|nr:hypothetical protein [Thermoproteota archaeon]
MSNKNCKHIIKYYGAINIFAGPNIEGVIDVYHCRKCKALFADLRRIGIFLTLSSKIGFDELENDNEWLLLVCLKGDEHKFNLVQGKIGSKIMHECFEGNSEINLEKEEEVFKTGDIWHRVFRVSKYINKEIEILH